LCLFVGGQLRRIAPEVAVLACLRIALVSIDPYLCLFVSGQLRRIAPEIASFSSLNVRRLRKDGLYKTEYCYTQRA
jgi:hypothetical protein